jgi:hypothetical protein
MFRFRSSEAEKKAAVAAAAPGVLHMKWALCREIIVIKTCSWNSFYV